MLALWCRRIWFAEALLGRADVARRLREHACEKNKSYIDQNWSRFAIWHACPPRRCIKHAIGNKMSGADWKPRLGLQYVAISASGQCHNGSEVCAHAVVRHTLRRFFVTRRPEVSTLNDLRQLNDQQRFLY
jgi:hypothetical protein